MLIELERRNYLARLPSVRRRCRRWKRIAKWAAVTSAILLGINAAMVTVDVGDDLFLLAQMALLFILVASYAVVDGLVSSRTKYALWFLHHPIIRVDY